MLQVPDFRLLGEMYYRNVKGVGRQHSAGAISRSNALMVRELEWEASRSFLRL